ncbi:MAG: hypothetical protein IKH51_00720 [Clostridia bacterium]|nr:hypothetical protein [Clostridia bacterium]
MKRVICFALAVIFVFALCSCAKEQQEPENTLSDKEMIVQMLSDLSNKNFKRIASQSVMKDGSSVTEEDIQVIYDFLVKTGVDPSLGFSVDNYNKNIGIDASGDANTHMYDIIALCGENQVYFRVTISHTEKGNFFTQIYTVGVVPNGTQTEAETE